MQRLLTDFRVEFLDRVLEILWRQWSALGVSGHGPNWKGSVIDPEALLAFSCTIGRHDARLFDAIVEWVQLNERFINVQRAKRIIKDESFKGKAVFGAAAATAATSVHAGKWGGVTDLSNKKHKKAEALFYFEDGSALPIVKDADPRFREYGFLRDRFEPRGVARSFRPEPPSNLQLRLRALLGVNARCEILLYLLLNDEGSPRAMGRDCYYFPATMTKALAEMRQSGYVISRVEGRHRYYRLFPETWKKLLLQSEKKPRWIVWPRLFSALEHIWLFLNQEGLDSKESLVQASSLRRILIRSVVPKLNRCGLPLVFGGESAHLGESLLPFFVGRVRDVLSDLEHLGGIR